MPPSPTLTTGGGAAADGSPAEPCGPLAAHAKARQLTRRRADTDDSAHSMADFSALSSARIGLTSAAGSKYLGMTGGIRDAGRTSCVAWARSLWSLKRRRRKAGETVPLCRLAWLSAAVTPVTLPVTLTAGIIRLRRRFHTVAVSRPFKNAGFSVVVTALYGHGFTCYRYGALGANPSSGDRDA